MKQKVLIAFVLLLVPIAGAQVYTIADLGPLSPTAINSWAQVVGNYNGHGYIWDRRGGMRDLGLLPGGTFSQVAAINDLGTVVGSADGVGTVIYPFIGGGIFDECSDMVQPFVWRAGSVRGLGGILTPEAYDACFIPFYGSGINGSGLVLGYMARYHGQYQWGLLWTSAAGMDYFGYSLPPTFINDVSNTGQIVGSNGKFEEGTGHAISWMKGVATDLNPHNDTATDSLGYNSSANGVNDLGQIVGWATTAPVGGASCYFLVSAESCPIHATLWSASGAIRDLRTLPGDTVSAASKINFFGLAIGSSGSTEDYSSYGLDGFPAAPLAVIGRPFIWSASSGMRDLNTLIRPNSGWVLNSASDINVWGQIVGDGTLNGQPHGFLLTPTDPFEF